MTRVRVHQHVNPLAKYYRELPIEPLDCGKTFENPRLPLHLDIGCGRGRFLLEMAAMKPGYNFLGVDIREPLVIEANEIRDDRKMTNLHYEFCNATIDLNVLLRDLPENSLQFVSIQFPDPWFKKRHSKRRMVKDQLVETIYGHLSKEGTVFIQTDVEFLSAEMVELFEEGGFQRFEIDENPLPAQTERERSVIGRDLPVYRAILKKEYEAV
ncbi:MAG: tRNA (guanosine(46)-N7)-methyltransferase TrmB [Acidobacteria bacterium]|nr:tRNA (guanosine(46)-N7)-methyltransferase TrmB [Acidobacteriota bacterium]